MNRFVTVCAVVCGLLAAPAGIASAAPPVAPGGQCDGVVDVRCREHQCQPDELDCGLIPPCRLWVAGACLVA